MNNYRHFDVTEEIQSRMVLAEDIRKVILNLADQKGPVNSFSLIEIARVVDSENWAKQMEQVQLVADSLVKEGQIVLVKRKKAGEKEYSKNHLITLGR